MPWNIAVTFFTLPQHSRQTFRFKGQSHFPMDRFHPLVGIKTAKKLVAQLVNISTNNSCSGRSMINMAAVTSRKNVFSG